ncbi:MAG: hypothetical protein R3C70_12615 [Geminicoccaceae bacterium]
MIHEVTMEAVLAPGRLERAWIAVKRNRGAPGIDGKSIADTASHLREHWPAVRARLEAGSYTPSAVRGVTIPKPLQRVEEMPIAAMRDEKDWKRGGERVSAAALRARTPTKFASPFRRTPFSACVAVARDPGKLLPSGKNRRPSRLSAFLCGEGDWGYRRFRTD